MMNIDHIESIARAATPGARRIVDADNDDTEIRTEKDILICSFGGGQMGDWFCGTIPDDNDLNLMLVDPADIAHLTQINRELVAALMAARRLIAGGYRSSAVDDMINVIDSAIARSKGDLSESK